MKYIVKYVSCVFLCTFISLMGVFCAFGATFRYDGSLIEVEDPYYDEKDLLILIDNDTIIVPEEKYNEWIFRLGDATEEGTEYNVIMKALADVVYRDSRSVTDTQATI